MREQHARTLLATAIWIAFCLTALAAETQVPRWQPHDFTFAAEAGEGNPFQVLFSAEVTGPDGTTLKVPGFYDGNGTWKIRLAPMLVGAWSLETQSSLPALDKQRRAFDCIAKLSPKVHGALRVDPEHKSQFVFEDGTRYFPMGYECDWLWALDSNPNDSKLPTMNAFLDKLTDHGFNYIILNAYAHDTSWRKGRSGDDDYGPPAQYAWEGTNDAPDHTRFNLQFWQHYDRMLAALYARGIEAHMLMRVYNKKVNWPKNGSPEDDLYFRWLIARYAAYPNVRWDFAKEAQYEKDLAYKQGRLKFIRDNDPFKRLLTVHDDRATYDRGSYNDLVDFRSDQQHTKWRESMLAHLAQRAWPVINTEFGYEYGPGGAKDKTYNQAQSAEENCRRGWEVCMAGGFGVYYYTYTAWDVVRPQDTPPGYAYFKHLRNFFERTNYWRMKPVEGVASEGYCLADAEREYIAFMNVAGPLKLNLPTKPFKAQWYRPYTGEGQDAGSITGPVAELQPPASFGPEPIALWITAR